MITFCILDHAVLSLRNDEGEQDKSGTPDRGHRDRLKESHASSRPTWSSTTTTRVPYLGPPARHKVLAPPFSSSSHTNHNDQRVTKMSRASVSPTSSHHQCRWAWCRDTFDTADKLAKHVLDDHVANETPMKREDVRLEMRAFDGTSFGEDSVRTSLLMHEAYLDDEEKDGTEVTNGQTIQSMDPLEQHPSNIGRIVSPGLRPRTPDQHGSVHYGDNDTMPSPSSDQEAATLPSSPSPAPSRFREIAESSSQSPDSESMSVPPAPSLAEMLANTLNRVSNANLSAIDGLSDPRFADLPQSENQNSSRSPSAPRPSNYVSLGSEENPQVTVGRDLCSPSSRSRPVSRTSMNYVESLPQPVAQTRAPPIEARNGTPQSLDETQSVSTLSSSARPFRSGAIRLEPSLSPSTPTKARSLESSGLVIESHNSSSSPFIRAQPITNFINDIDILSTSLEPDSSIPAFTQAFDMQEQSQWPLATQASYSFDSQLAFNSQ